MRIFHLVFTNGQGGLEQAYLDYSRALIAQGHELHAVLLPDAPYREAVAATGATLHLCKARGFYDPLALLQLRRLFTHHRPEVILAHNGRAIQLTHYAAWKLNLPVIGVSHSYKTEHSRKADALLLLTPHMQRHFEAAGYPPERIALMPNMIALRPPAAWTGWPRHAAPIIGCIARLAPEKGVDRLLEAVALLKRSGVTLHVTIAGEGEEKTRLQEMTHQLDIAELVHFCGWVHDKARFFDSIDLLCVSSLYEPFGLVVLEAWNHGVPLIAADAEGPSELITDSRDGLLYAKQSASALAICIEQLLLKGEPLARQLVEGGQSSVQPYSEAEGAKRLEELLHRFYP